MANCTIEPSRERLQDYEDSLASHGHGARDHARTIRDLRARSREDVPGLQCLPQQRRDHRRADARDVKGQTGSALVSRHQDSPDGRNKTQQPYDQYSAVDNI